MTKFEKAISNLTKAVKAIMLLTLEFDVVRVFVLNEARLK